MIAQNERGSTEDMQTILNQRLEDIGWALFLIMIGFLLIIPDEQIPQGTWLVGTGLIMIGLNAVRYIKRIKIHIFSLTLGLLALIAGTVQILGITLPLFAAFLIVLGVSILFKSVLEKGKNHLTHQIR
ncbi:MAG TPA: hypothetical protein VLH08_00640 [Acidobacteriota bacterium]|nr:hypothetical protein [Acidobacteriota bacterium]